ncbi:MAG: TlyA family RNA methyltransferase [Desulfobacca sp.]|nr:TlyA family RNA methyltransferase [Desulfobacca sp.]
MDCLVVERGLAASRERARALILAGKVLVAGVPVTKAGALVSSQAPLTLQTADIPYVSRGGVKLAAALEHFQINVAGQVILDVGASTGGFTDCVLQRGAKRVYAVDVGYGQLAWSLRQDARVVILERTNIRYLPREAIPEPIDLATIDVSFISLTLVLPKVREFVRPGGAILALVKPQFEVGRHQVGKGGVVRDPRLQLQVVEDLKALATSLGLEVFGHLPSPILGPKGNQEYLLYLGVPLRVQ